MKDLQNIKTKQTIMKTYIRLSILTLLSILFVACSNDDDNSTNNSNLQQPGVLSLNFDAVVENENFELNKTYTINNEQVSFSQFRYWISNVVLIDNKGNRFDVPNSYYLMEETEAISIQDDNYEYPPSKRETITLIDLPSGDYTNIEFGIGVDADYNDNLSLQAGELSQLNGMTNISWMWHTSYIFTSIKGKIESDDTTLVLETGLNENFSTVNLHFNEPIIVSAQENASVNFSTNIAAILSGLNFNETPEIGAATPEEMSIMANNFNQYAIKVVAKVNE